jgi:CAAX prenyl protease-like protein
MVSILQTKTNDAPTVPAPLITWRNAGLLVLAFLIFWIPYTSWLPRIWDHFGWATIGLIGLFRVWRPRSYRRDLGIDLDWRQGLLSSATFVTLALGAAIAIPALARNAGLRYLPYFRFDILFQSFNEELVARVLAMTFFLRICRGRRLAASCTAAAIFSTLHLVFYDIALTPVTLLSLFLVAFALNQFYLHTGHVGYGVAIHAAWNLTRFGGSFHEMGTSRHLGSAQTFNLLEGSITMLGVSLALALLGMYLYSQSSAKREEAATPAAVPDAILLPVRKKRWRISFGGVVGLLFAAWCTLAITVQVKLSKIRAGLPAEFAEARARDAARPVLRGTALPGNAWDDYAPALAEAEKSVAHASRLSDYLARKEWADRAAGEALRKGLAGPLAKLLDGTHRATGQYPYHWEKGAAVSFPRFVSMLMLTNAAVAESRALVEAGKPREAAELLLDICQFGRDTAHNGLLVTQLMGIMVYSRALDELRDIVFSEELTSEDLVEVDRELDILDSSYENCRLSVLNERLWTVSMLNYSRMTTMASGLRQYERMAEACGWPWADVQTFDRRLTSILSRSSTIAIPEVKAAEQFRREVQVHLRLVRAVVHLRATGEVVAADDPFGDRLKSSNAGGVVKFWSVGSNGTDEKGKGGWPPVPNRDIVLVMKEK